MQYQVRLPHHHRGDAETVYADTPSQAAEKYASYHRLRDGCAVIVQVGVISEDRFLVYSETSYAAVKDKSGVRIETAEPHREG